MLCHQMWQPSSQHGEHLVQMNNLALKFLHPQIALVSIAHGGTPQKSIHANASNKPMVQATSTISENRDQRAR